MGQTLEFETVLKMRPEDGVPLGPEIEVIETQFAKWARRRFDNSKLFTYRHRQHKTWILAQWLNDTHTRFTEIWGVEGHGDERLDNVVGEDCEMEILGALLRKEVLRELLKRERGKREREEEVRRKEIQLQRKDKAKHIRKQVERKGLLTGDTEQYLDRLERGNIPWAPKDS